MREDLAREFPEAARALDRARARFTGRRLSVRTEATLWATVSAIGAGFLVASIVQALVGLINHAAQLFRIELPFALFPAVSIAGSATAAAVALVAGGPMALALDVAYVAIGLLIRIPGQRTFCERSGGAFPTAPGPDQCSALGYLVSLWPQLVGIGLGLALARFLVARSGGINTMFRIAGTLAIAQFVVSAIWGATAAQTTDSTASTLTIAAGVVAAAVAAGVVAAQLPRGVRNAAIVAAIWLLPWFALQVPFAAQLSGPIPEENRVPIVVSILIEPIAAAFLVLSAMIAARSRFVPRERA
jgi:hypothetical protein